MSTIAACRPRDLAASEVILEVFGELVVGPDVVGVDVGPDCQGTVRNYHMEVGSVLLAAGEENMHFFPFTLKVVVVDTANIVKTLDLNVASTVILGLVVQAAHAPESPV